MGNGTEKGVTGVTLVTLSHQSADNQTLPHMAVTPVTGVTANSVYSTSTLSHASGCKLKYQPTSFNQSKSGYAKNHRAQI